MTLQQGNYYSKHSREMPQQNKWSNGLNDIRYHGATVSMRSYSRTTDVANITKDATTKQLIQQI